MKNLKEAVMQSLPPDATGTALPLWVTDFTDAQTGFQTLALDFLDRYMSELRIEKEATSQALTQAHTGQTTTAQALEILQTKDVRQLLAEDSEFNGKVLDRLIQERSEYEQFVKQVLDEATLTKNKTNNKILKEVCLLIEELFVDYLKITTDTLHRFRTQRSALIDVLSLDEKTVAEKVGLKQKLILSQQTQWEKSVSKNRASLSAISENMKKIEQAMTEVAKKSTERY